MPKNGDPFSFNTHWLTENNWKPKTILQIKLLHLQQNYYIEKIRHFQFPSVLNLSGVGGYPLVPLNPPPSFHWPPTGLVGNSQKYIADPLCSLILPQIEYTRVSLVQWPEPGVRMGGSIPLNPAESKQKLFTFVDNGPSIILIFPNSSNIAIIVS